MATQTSDDSARPASSAVLACQPSVLALFHAPIFCLPVELLAFIFLLARDKTRGARSRQVLRLCRVCTHWNNVATLYSSLWTVIDISITHPQLMERFLTNSKEAKIDVDLALDALINRETLLLVIKALPRVEVLSIEPEYCAFDETFELSEYWASGLPASSLGSLNISSTTVPDDFFTRTGFPSLRHLLVDRCKFNPRALPWGQLFSLELRLANCDISVSDLLDGLRGAHRLKELELFHSFDVPEDEAVTRRVANPVQLNALSSLSVNAMSCHSIITFLNQVSVPPTASVTAEPDDGDWQWDCELVIAATFQCRNGFGLPILWELCLHLDDEASFTAIQAPINRFSPTTHICFMGYDADEVEPISLISCILQRHNLSYLTTLDLTHTPRRYEGDDQLKSFEFESELWELTRNLYTIETIEVQDAFAESFVQFLGCSMKASEELFIESANRMSSESLDEHGPEFAATSQYLFQRLLSNFFSLKKLTLDFRPYGIWLDEPLPLYGGLVGSKLDFQRFCGGLVFRKKCGLELNKLKLAGIDESALAEELDTLNMVVGRIEYPWRVVDVA